MDIAILGPLTLRRAGRPIEVSGPRARTLVAALVLAEGHPLSAERIAGLLWADEPPDNPANAVQAQISRLLRSLRTADAADRLVTTPAGYTLAVTADEVDAWRFDAMVTDAGAAVDRGEARTVREALALWRGAGVRMRSRRASATSGSCPGGT